MNAPGVVLQEMLMTYADDTCCTCVASSKYNHVKFRFFWQEKGNISHIIITPSNHEEVESCHQGQLLALV